MNTNFSIGQELTFQQMQTSFPQALASLESYIADQGGALEDQNGVFVIEPTRVLSGTYGSASRREASSVSGVKNGALCYHDDNFALAWFEGSWNSFG